MAKRSNTRESLSFAFELLKRIPRSYKITAGELKGQLEGIGLVRDIRTVQRNLEMLCDHFDIEKDDRSKPYGYSWRPESKGWSMQSLSPHESLLVHLADEYLQNLLPGNIMSSLRGLFNEARYNLNPSRSRKKEREWLEKVRVVSESQPLLPPVIDSDVFKKISEALFHNRWLTLEYTNAKECLKVVEVMPLGLAQQGSRLYMVCRFKGYKNERTLAVHRIRKAMVSTFTFTRPESFRLEKYDAEGRFGFGEGRKCKLTFCISKPEGYHLLETPLSECQRIKEYDTHYRVCAEIIESMQLKRWLRGFGEDVWNIELSKPENFS